VSRISALVVYFGSSSGRGLVSLWKFVWLVRISEFKSPPKKRSSVSVKFRFGLSLIQTRISEFVC
jgi:hypothetical protein